MISFLVVSGQRLGLRLGLGLALGLGGGGFFPHTHACKAGTCQACGLVRVGSGVVKSERAAKQVAPTPHATTHKQLSLAYTTPAHVGFPIPPCDVCVAS